MSIGDYGLDLASQLRAHYDGPYVLTGRAEQVIEALAAAGLKLAPIDCPQAERAGETARSFATSTKPRGSTREPLPLEPDVVEPIDPKGETADETGTDLLTALRASLRAAGQDPSGAGDEAASGGEGT